MAEPTAGQIFLLIVATAFFVIGGLCSVGRLYWNRNELRVASKACMYMGLVVSLGVLLWHSISRGRWAPIGDNFDALIWLALLLTGFVLYTQRSHPLWGFDWFVMPVVILLLLGAGHFGKAKYQPYYHEYGHSAWLVVHRLTSYAGAAVFAVAAATGAMYVLTVRRLRQKRSGGHSFGNLERLERLTLAAATLGFALLTIGVVTGIVEWAAGMPVGPVKRWAIGLSAAAWLAYAVVLHAPLNPRFRGRRVAWLSVIGFVLVIAAIVAVQMVTYTSKPS